MKNQKKVMTNLLLTQLCILIVAILLDVILNGNGLLRLFDFKWFYVLVALIGFVIYYLSNLLLGSLVPKKFYTNDSKFDKESSNGGLLYITITCLIVSFCEELLFRGVVQEHFGIIIATILFVLAHVRYLKKMFLVFYLILLGLILGFSFIVTNNLIAPIIIHFMIDFVSSLAIKQSGNK